MRVLDLFCGRWGWSRAFAARGWKCVGIDLVEPTEIPENCEFIKADVLECDISVHGVFWYGNYSSVRPDFIVASSPCEEFSVHGMKHFHPNPPYPELGIKLFNHTRSLCQASGLPFVMENVRAAQRFVGQAQSHAGSFYLWGTAVPPFGLPRLKKGLDMGRDPVTGKRTLYLGRRSSHNSKMRALDKAITATIPPELANCVAEYAERLLEQKVVAEHRT